MSRVRTAEELRTSLGQLRRQCGRSVRDVARKGGIGQGTTTNLVSGSTTPTRKSVAGFLTGCGLSPAHQRPWLEAYDRIYPDRHRAGSSPAPVMGRWLMRKGGGADARGYFSSRGRGHRGDVGQADMFRGRAEAIAAVRAWLSADEQPQRPLVITGQPGAGKSAVLARVVIELENEQCGPGAAINAQGATFADILDAVTAGVGLPARSTADTLFEYLRADQDIRLLLFVDGLDEVATADLQGGKGLDSTPWAFAGRTAPT
ncbi:helix-turn-helix domain-containing protein [Actinoplanes sp. CA-030573]|uniref:helix-turn-helix domain-containing protein n=1 Tax=Actinoplanes sp. CA-030573 TaxID=3239898 RepID=UPI003D8AD97C